MKDDEEWQQAYTAWDKHCNQMLKYGFTYKEAIVSVFGGINDEMIVAAATIPSICGCFICRRKDKHEQEEHE